MEFFQGTQKRVRKSRGKRAIRVRVLLYCEISVFSSDSATCIQTDTCMNLDFLHMVDDKFSSRRHLNMSTDMYG